LAGVSELLIFEIQPLSDVMRGDPADLYSIDLIIKTP